MRFNILHNRSTKRIISIITIFVVLFTLSYFDSVPVAATDAEVDNKNSSDNLLFEETFSNDESLLQESIALEEEIVEQNQPPVFNKSDLKILAKLLYGEARGVKHKQEQAAVVWVVLNRVESTNFPNSIKSVVTQYGQFSGYSKYNPVWQELYELAEDVMTRWYYEKQGFDNVGRVIPKNYLFFRGNGYRNYFRTSCTGGKLWKWKLSNPY